MEILRTQRRLNQYPSWFNYSTDTSRRLIVARRWKNELVTHNERIQEDSWQCPSSNTSNITKRRSRGNKLKVVAIENTKDMFADTETRTQKRKGRFSSLFPQYRLLPYLLLSWKSFFRYPLSRLFSLSLSQLHVLWHLWEEEIFHISLVHYIFKNLSEFNITLDKYFFFFSTNFCNISIQRYIKVVLCAKKK